MIWIHCSINKIHAVINVFLYLMKDGLDLSIVIKYIIFVQINSNIMDVIVPGPTWRHHSLTPLLWRIFSRGGYICFIWFLQCCFYMCCRGSYIYLFLCYFYFSDHFALSASLIMDAARERISLVEGSDTTYDNTSWFVGDSFPGVI